MIAATGAGVAAGIGISIAAGIGDRPGTTPTTATPGIRPLFLHWLITIISLKEGIDFPRSQLLTGLFAVCDNVNFPFSEVRQDIKSVLVEQIIFFAMDNFVLMASSIDAILPDGKKLVATNVITRTGPDAVTWQSKDRTLDGKPLPDVNEIKMKRVP
jgi:hypothetical protein